MSSIAFTNIETLVTNDSHIGDGVLGVLHGATLVVEDGVITQIAQQIPSGVDSEIDCSGKTLLPGFVDSHSHLIFAGDRAQEFSACLYLYLSALRPQPEPTQMLADPLDRQPDHIASESGDLRDDSPPFPLGGISARLVERVDLAQVGLDVGPGRVLQDHRQY